MLDTDISERDDTRMLHEPRADRRDSAAAEPPHKPTSLLPPPAPRSRAEPPAAKLPPAKEGDDAGTRDEKAPAKPLDKTEDKPKVEGKPADKGKAEGQPEDKPKSDDKSADKNKPKAGFVRRHPLAIVAVLIFAAVATGAGYVFYDNSSHFESTDDAFIASRQTLIAPKVTGYVATVPVTDNQHVEAGDVIATLDDRDYQAALAQSNAQVASSKAQIENVRAQTDVQRAQIEAAKAQVTSAKAALAFAQQQASRYAELAKTGSGTVQNAQQYTSQLDQQQASVNSAEANERVNERQLESFKAQLANAEASLAVSEAQLEQARLNVSYTVVRASEPGKIVQLTAEPGELAQPGTALTMFVPDEIWIVANFKETQLDHMRPGQPVTFSIDAYPEREFHGHVASVQPGSGTAFSLLPAQNATGNYVKIVQRVPVKIILDNPPQDVAIGPGMSVVPDVRVNPTPSIWENWMKRYDDYWKKP